MCNPEVTKEQCILHCSSYGVSDDHEELYAVFGFDEEQDAIVIDWTYEGTKKVDALKIVISDDGKFERVPVTTDALLFTADRFYFEVYHSAWWTSGDTLLVVNVWEQGTDEWIDEIWGWAVYKDDVCYKMEDLADMFLPEDAKIRETMINR